MAEKKKKKKTGRPKDSKDTKPRKRVEGEFQQPLAYCPHCESTEHYVLAKIREMEYCGIKDGYRFTSVIWRRVQCAHCERYFIAVERPYEPRKWGGE